jgi:hypothetical protein
VTNHVVGHEICLVSRVANPVRHSSRDRYIALSDVNCLAQAFERETKQLHSEDIISTKLWIERYKSGNISIFYKDKLNSSPPGSGLDRDIFVLCIQAPFQLEAFRRLGNGFIGIDATHNITHYKEMLLFTIMARDNWGHGKRHNYYF